MDGWSTACPEEGLTMYCIKTRGAANGGRTEVFRTYERCRNHENMFYFDVVRLYPSIHALDKYAIGFCQSTNAIVDGKIKRVAKCVVAPVLPDDITGKLRMYDINVTGIWNAKQLQKALGTAGMEFECILLRSIVRHNIMKESVRFVLE